MQFPHAKTKEEIFKELQTSETGLTSGEAKQRLKKDGCNEISKKKKNSEIIIFLKQFNSSLIYILLIAMAISFSFKHFVDGYVILAILLINAGIGYFEERKAEKAIESLEKLIVSYAKVLRDGEIVKIPSKELVQGDVIVIEEGDKIPADARLIESKNLRTQESSLTGESVPVDKSLKKLTLSTNVSERVNMVFLGTFAVSGEAKAVVVGTGNSTLIGNVASSIQEIVQSKTHFSEKVSQLTFQMAMFAIVGAGITFLIGYFFNKLAFFDIFLFTLASLVSGIPEGLPAVLMIVLAVGARKMAKKNAIIRHLPSVETLGVATIIATDKTGTLTSNALTIKKILISDGEFEISGDDWDPTGKIFFNKREIIAQKFLSLEKLASISRLCTRGNLVRKNNSYEIIGDPTEVAFKILEKKINVKGSEEKLLDDLPFSSELKFRASLVSLQNQKNDARFLDARNSSKEFRHKKQIYSIGAFEKILDLSSSILKNKQVSHMVSSDKKQFLDKAENLAKQGYRVLAVAYKEVNLKINSLSYEAVDNLIFVGIVAMKDTPRLGVKESIEKAKFAGIRIIMKTGDHKETALAIAKEIGLASEGAKALTQEELERMSESEFIDAVNTVNIFARLSPTMKLKIVQTLQEQGEIVAMTGDGVNDAPALKKADIGISMGVIGTDVARESSEIILADDNFSSIVDAIEEGRTVFNNIKRSSFFLITMNAAEDATIISSMSMGLPLPLLPIQLLYLNIVSDTFTGISLAMEPTHDDVLAKPPRKKQERILDKKVIPFFLIISLLMVIGTVPLFFYFLEDGIEKARTTAFVSMSLFQLFNVYNLRSLKYSIFKIGFFSNKWVTYGVSLSFFLMIVVLYIPFFSRIFGFVPLTLFEFLLVTLVASSILVVGEVYKIFKKRG